MPREVMFTKIELRRYSFHNFMEITSWIREQGLNLPPHNASFRKISYRTAAIVFDVLSSTDELHFSVRFSDDYYISFDEL